MKAVLISIQPKWCELIASGKKTIVVRKTKPKLEAPFKVYIYCTANKNGTKDLLEIHGSDGKIRKANGKVIGEFVCDDIDKIAVFKDFLYCVGNSQANKLKQMCLTIEEIKAYLGCTNLGYDWHISNLVIYDEPKELSEFKRVCDGDYESCQYAIWQTPGWVYEPKIVDCKPISKPPQSWCYVEEREQ